MKLALAIATVAATSFATYADASFRCTTYGSTTRCFDSDTLTTTRCTTYGSTTRCTTY